MDNSKSGSEVAQVVSSAQASARDEKEREERAQRISHIVESANREWGFDDYTDSREHTSRLQPEEE